MGSVPPYSDNLLNNIILTITKITEKEKWDTAHR